MKQKLESTVICNAFRGAEVWRGDGRHWDTVPGADRLVHLNPRVRGCRARGSRCRAGARASGKGRPAMTKLKMCKVDSMKDAAAAYPCILLVHLAYFSMENQSKSLQMHGVL